MYREPDRLGRIRHGLRRFGELSRAEGFPVVLGIVPWLQTAAGEYEHRRVHQIVRNEAAAAGLQVVDLANPMLAVGLEGLRATPADATHPNSEGHRIMARAVGELILERELLR